MNIYIKIINEKYFEYGLVFLFQSEPKTIEIEQIDLLEGEIWKICSK